MIVNLRLALFRLPRLNLDMALGSQIPEVRFERDGSSSPEDFLAHCPDGLIARLRIALLSRIAAGYEDEAGFHFGAPFSA